MALKHLWCLGLVVEPPSCPVDGRVLQRAGSRHPETRWAYVNTPAEHRTKVEVLRARARETGQSLAVWELAIR